MSRTGLRPKSYAQATSSQPVAPVRRRKVPGIDLGERFVPLLGVLHPDGRTISEIQKYQSEEIGYSNNKTIKIEYTNLNDKSILIEFTNGGPIAYIHIGNAEQKVHVNGYDRRIISISAGVIIIFNDSSTNRYYISSSVNYGISVDNLSKIIKWFYDSLFKNSKIDEKNMVEIMDQLYGYKYILDKGHRVICNRIGTNLNGGNILVGVLAKKKFYDIIKADTTTFGKHLKNLIVNNNGNPLGIRNIRALNPNNVYFGQFGCQITEDRMNGFLQFWNEGYPWYNGALALYNEVDRGTGHEGGAKLYYFRRKPGGFYESFNKLLNKFRGSVFKQRLQLKPKQNEILDFMVVNQITNRGNISRIFFQFLNTGHNFFGTRGIQQRRTYFNMRSRLFHKNVEKFNVETFKTSASAMEELAAHFCAWMCDPGVNGYKHGIDESETGKSLLDVAIITNPEKNKNNLLETLVNNHLINGDNNGLIIPDVLPMTPGPYRSMIYGGVTANANRGAAGS